MSNTREQKSYSPIPLIVLVSAICWFTMKDTTLNGSVLFVALSIPFGLFVLYLFLRIAAGVLSRGRI